MISGEQLDFLFAGQAWNRLGLEVVQNLALLPGVRVDGRVVFPQLVSRFFENPVEFPLKNVQIHAVHHFLLGPPSNRIKLVPDDISTETIQLR
ncbi:hypothetical protein C444_07620 [Haloarcula japonica DSM 6131]|uniref:Uncharacterized protein n=1 Tax=Haloarcula japonica (strain ATCC 49778 / DSM 6131 / JCM 7785 / NBRC 101032 / NCIMB 13157 / TR-1) TaxID=1227453 RepID=M0LED6_HALJT|nr:hypothetical protein C444_07620 [Haloarcula japonica DSM 6131]